MTLRHHQVLLSLVLSLLLAGSGICSECQDSENNTIQVASDPQDLTVDLGQTEVRFQCSFSGNPDINTRYGWIHYHPLDVIGEQIGTSLPHRNYLFSAATAGDLVITEVKDFHAGFYQCSLLVQGTTDTCRVFTANASLTVQGPPQLQWGEEGDQNITVTVPSTGETAIQATVYSVLSPTIEGVERASGAAVRDGVFELSVSGGGANGLSVVSVTIRDPRIADSGSYNLVIFNTVGPTPLAFQVEVTGPDPPEITLDSLLLRDYGAEVAVDCSVQPSASTHGLELAWTYSNTKIPARTNPPQNVYTVREETDTSTSITLTIASLDSSVTGVYICTANNSRDNVEKNTMICGPPPRLSAPDVSVCKPNASQNCVRTISWAAPTGYDCTEIVGYSVYVRDGSNTLQLMEELVAGTRYDIPNSLSVGTYEVQVSATAGNLEPRNTIEGERSQGTPFTLDEVPTTADESSSDDDLAPVVASVASAGVLILLLTVTFGTVIFFLCCYYPHKKRLTSQEQTWSPEEELDNGTVPNTYTALKLPPSELPPSPESLPFSIFSAEIDPKWEFPRENIQLTEVLHEGHFTVLYKGIAKGIREQPLDVAVKSIREDATEDEAKALIAEMETLSAVGPHPNIVSLMRVCTVGKPIYVVMEYMCHGDLLGFMRASRGHHGMYTISPGIYNQPPCLTLSSRDLLSIGAKIANGMRYLADRKIVHRALCCRHVLVGAGFEIKIYNVGSDDIAVDARDGILKWLAPETLFDGTYSVYTDVWSFGITLWELVTLGGTPYAEIEAEDLYTQLYAGMRMPKPMHCSHEIYEVMCKCWERNPTDRPHFADIFDQIDTLAASKVSYINLRSYNPMEYSQYDDQPQLSTAL